ncbi:MAG: hypothetical protein M0Z48_00420 [Nitrospiraceae bacterium]|nr:hypothetical protein [Nitrospiraceae bacterium]
MNKKDRRWAIRTRLLRHEISQAAIALQAGVTQGAVSRVIGGSLDAPKIRRAIADALRLKYEAIWPREDNNRKKGA